MKRKHMPRRRFLEAGAVALGAGSELTKGAKTGDYALITETARQYVKAIEAARVK